MLLKNSDKSVNLRYVFFAFGVAVNCQWVASVRGMALWLGVLWDCVGCVCLGISVVWVSACRWGLECGRMASCRILLTNKGKVRHGPFCPNDGTKTAFLLLPCSSVRRRVGLSVPRAFLPLSLEGSDYPNLIIKNR